MPSNLQARAPAWAAAIAAGAAAARLALLLLRPLWYDEIFTVWAARASVAALMTALSFDSGPPLFYLLEKPFVLLAESARLPDSLARLLPFAATLLLFAAARTLDSRAARGRFVVLLAASPLLLAYSGEARAYALLSLGSFVLFLLAFRSAPTRSRLALTALAASALLAIHYLALFVVVAVALCAFALSRRTTALAALSGFLPFAFWVPVLKAQPAEALAWMRESAPASLIGFLSALGGAGRIPDPLGGPLPTLLFGLGAAAGALALFAVGRDADRETRAALWVSLLALSGAAAASIVRPVAFAGRTEMAVLPIWLWGLARSGEAGRLGRRAAAAAASIGAVSSLVLFAAPRDEPEYAAAARALSTLAARGDLVVAGGACYLPARLERDRGRLPANLAALPESLERHPGWFAPAPPTQDDALRLEHRLAAVPAGRRVLVLLPAALLTPALTEVLGRRGITAIVRRTQSIVLLCSARAGALRPAGDR